MRRERGLARSATATDRRLRRACAARRRAPEGSAGSSARAGRPRSRRIRTSPRGETGAGRLRHGRQGGVPHRSLPAPVSPLGLARIRRERGLPARAELPALPPGARRRAAQARRSRRSVAVALCASPLSRRMYDGRRLSRVPAHVPLSKYHYVVVEGPIGVGKTSLAKRLAGRLNSTLVLERPEQNPFLPRFYQDMSRFALPTQLFFLFQRIGQLRELAQMDLFTRLTVCDFLLEKDPLFARLTLSGEVLHLYQQIYDLRKPQASNPA